MFAAPQSTHATASAGTTLSATLEALPVAGLTMLYSLRLLITGYGGPLVALRRNSDNALQAFGYDASGLLDVAAITTWLAGSTARIETWYNQGSGPNAVNTVQTEQPVLNTAGRLSLVYNGGSKLTANASATELTAAGVDGTLTIVCASANAVSESFGAWTASSRWSGHLNWSDGNCYFDTGPCCQAARVFTNANQGVAAQYTFSRSAAAQQSRKRGIVQVQGAVNGACSATVGFGVGYATGGGNASHSGPISEFLLCNTALNSTVMAALENEQITYWGV